LSRDNAGLGSAGFVGKHGLRNADAAALAEEVVQQAESDGLEVIRLSFADQHGVLHGKTIPVGQLAAAMQNGISMTTTLILKDTSHRTVFPVWSEGGGLGDGNWEGAGDFIMVPDPATFRILPWSPHSGWMLCDIHFSTGGAIPFSTRAIGKQAVTKLAEAGYDYIAGLEVEFSVFRMTDPALSPSDAVQPGKPPSVSLLAQGFRYLSEQAYDELEPVLDLIRRDAEKLGLPVRSVEAEFGPSQCEFTFAPAAGITHADNMILFRSMVKQVCRRHGYHATFMCRPRIENIFANGWHLHQSLVDSKTGANLFAPERDSDILSDTGRAFVAGLLERGAESCVFTTPTINGYRRYRPHALAPDRIQWGRDNKGAMIRAIGGIGDPGSRVENRVGEPAANPYLYLASQMLAGLDGITRGLTPPAPSNSPYDGDAPRLPQTLLEAVDSLERSDFWRAEMGSAFIDYLVRIKKFEINRYLSEISEWEQQEYFQLF
jgi:glutamine synthetase